MDLSTLPAMGPETWQYALSVAMGVGLAATCGLRTFLPLLALNLVARFGGVELNEGLAFMGSWPATAVFATATVLELVADKVPGVDHLLDSVGLVVKPIAATLLAAAVLTGMDPLLAGVLGMIGGGAPASAVGLLKANVRAASTLTTAGVGNVVLSLVEDGVALVAVIFTVVVPVLTLLMLALALTLAWRLRPGQRRATPGP